MVLFGEEKDWKEFLCEDGQVELCELLERAKKHRCAYMQADDVKVAQLWCALTEVAKELKETKAKLARVENSIKAIAKMGDAAKREMLRERMKEVFKPKTTEEKEQVDKIVDSLMEY